MQSVLNKANDEIALMELFKALWGGKFIVLAFAIVFSGMSVFYALSIPNIYKSTVLLTAADEGKSGVGSKLTSQFGGLAAMAGVNLGSATSDKSALALEIIKSRSFIVEFVEYYDFKVNIMAVKDWDAHQNALVYNDNVYDSKLKLWVREAVFPRVAEPSSQEVYEKFLKEHLVITSDKKSGLTQISVFHASPYIAKDIADKLVEAINSKIKKDDIEEANNSINYLTAALQETVVADMQKIFYELIEQQEQTKMLANARSEYVFKVIDPAVVPELKDGPKRATLCIFGTLLGVLLGSVIVLIRFFIKNK